jgi:hypothetical protein
LEIFVPSSINYVTMFDYVRRCGSGVEQLIRNQ